MKEKILHGKNVAMIMKSASEKELNYYCRSTFMIKIGVHKTLYLRKKFARLDCHNNGKIKMFENI